MEKRISVTMAEMQRYKVLSDVLEGKIEATEAARLSKLSYVHILQLKKKMKEGGIESFIRRLRLSPKKIPKAKALTY